LKLRHPISAELAGAPQAAVPESRPGEPWATSAPQTVLADGEIRLSETDRLPLMGEVVIKCARTDAFARAG